MLTYTLRRLLYMVITLWIIVSLTFFLMKLLPGDPFGEAITKLPPESMQILIKQYGLDRPVWEQYLTYMGHVLQGDLGVSYQYPTRSVVNVIQTAFPASFELGIESLIIALIVGLFLGIVAALKHNKAGDYTASIVALIGISIPSFVIGPLLSYYIGVKLRLLPAGLWLGPEYRILPALALSLGTIAILTRMMRASMLEVMNQDFIKTAKSKGLSRKTIVGKHMIRNAILPVVTILGPIAVNVLTGTLVVEKIFSVPGLGNQFATSVLSNDYTLITGLTLFYAGVLVVVMFLTDIAYNLIDPRIRLGKGK
ncbi:ABC transporter permease [Cohnella pontilimi]|uniref:ABC transporter permease n=1 Tax=Cohnella pontilimi TaxID=2564100 RepID=A0A4U0F7R0_9BACL|nr:ABC transporter permease [Cohnella pontilimi]TJY40757.1 ABC transporter permease [Cohnella pontilimi]